MNSLNFTFDQNQDQQNTSGQGNAAVVPFEVDRWNWGAFLLTWIWGIGNNTFIAFLTFVPFLGLVMPFVLGAKGSSWAWKNKRWESVEQFKAVQRKWALWGLVVVAAIIAFCAGFVFLVMVLLKSTGAYKLAEAKLESSPQVSQMLGKPYSTGIPVGNIESSGPDGKANISFSVNGPKGKGTVYLEAVKQMGQWKIKDMVLEEEGTGKRIDLNR